MPGASSKEYKQTLIEQEGEEGASVNKQTLMDGPPAKKCCPVCGYREPAGQEEDFEFQAGSGRG